MKNSSIIDRPLSAQESAKPDVPPPPSPFLVKFDLTTHHLVMVGVVYLFYLGYRVLYTLNPEAFGFFLLFLYAEMRSCGVSYVRHIVDFWE